MLEVKMVFYSQKYFPKQIVPNEKLSISDSMHAFTFHVNIRLIDSGEALLRLYQA